MKINWKVRFKNKVWLGSFCSLIAGLAYSMISGELYAVGLHFSPISDNIIMLY